MRPAYLAGRWYPADARSCTAAIDAHAAAGTDPQPGPWRALIGPHAGWTYSGDTAGQTYRWLAASQPTPDLVVVFGSHRGPSGPSTVFVDDGWDTPLGACHTPVALAEQVASALQLQAEPSQPRRPDNAVELHLPFIKRFFGDAELLMVGVEAGPRALEIGRTVGRLVKEASRDAVFVGSTDLSHYGPNYQWAPQGTGPAAVRWVREVNDRGFIDRVLADDPAGALQHAIDHQSACCPGAVVATIEATRAFTGQVSPHLVDHTLSCDVRPSDSFVGYAGVLL